MLVPHILLSSNFHATVMVIHYRVEEAQVKIKKKYRTLEKLLKNVVCSKRLKQNFNRQTYD